MLERTRLDRREQAVSAAERRLAALTTVEEAATVTAETSALDEPPDRGGPGSAGTARIARGSRQGPARQAGTGRGSSRRPRTRRHRPSGRCRQTRETEGAPGREDRFARVMDAVEELVRLLRAPLLRLAGDENTGATALLPGPPEREAAEPGPDLTARPEPSPPPAAARVDHRAGATDAEQETSTGHLLFLSTSSGYRLVERDGPTWPAGIPARAQRAGRRGVSLGAGDGGDHRPAPLAAAG